MNLPKYLGITSLRLYTECPRCFWLSKVAGLEDKPSPAFALGSEVHFGIAEYHKGREGTPKISPEAGKLVTTYMGNVGQSEIEETEMWFEIPLCNIITNECLPFGLHGSIDGVNRKTGWIYEHKTSKRHWRMEDVESDIQATAYAYAYYMRYGELPVGIMFQIVRKGLKKPKVEKLPTYRTEADLVRLWNWAGKLYKKMEAGEFEPKQTRFGYHHYLCPYYTGR